MFPTLSRGKALAQFASITLICALALASLSTLAQNKGAPLSDPTVDEVINALGSASVNKALSFRRTPVPDVNHYCPEVSAAQGNSSAAGRNKNLEVIPYDGGHTASADLAINFGFGSDKLESSDRRLLDTLAQALRDPRLVKGRFAIAGHTDSVGANAVNRELSCARAIAARSYLIAQGVAGERLSAYGFGSDRLLDQGNPTSGVNRRVEIRRDVDFRGN